MKMKRRTNRKIQSLSRPVRTRSLARKKGYEAGFQYGYHLGVCHAFRQQTAVPEEKLFDLHVVYVQEGLFTLNEGILSGLSGLVRELTVCDPHEDVAARLAAMEHRPDLVIVLNGLHAFPVSQVDAIRHSGIPVAVWFADDPYYTERTIEIAPHYDFVFTHERSCVPLYEAGGCPRVYHLPLAVSPEIFQPRTVPLSKQSDVLFVGTAFWNRVALFDQILESIGQYRFFLIGGLWDRLQAFSKFADRIRLAPLSSVETADYYSGAKIVINVHRSPDDPEHNQNTHGLPGLSVNPRTFEVSACAPMQLTDVREELPAFYVPGQEIETYHSAQELIRKIDYYLVREKERQAIAYRGYRRTITEHTYRNRLTVLLQTFLSNHLISRKGEG